MHVMKRLPFHFFFQSTVDQDKRHKIRRQLRPRLPQQQQWRTFEVTRLLKSLQLSQQQASVHREQHGQGSAWSSISVSVVPIELPDSPPAQRTF